MFVIVYIIVFPKRLYNDLLLGRRLHDLSVQDILYLLNLSDLEH